MQNGQLSEEGMLSLAVQIKSTLDEPTSFSYACRRADVRKAILSIRVNQYFQLTIVYDGYE